MIAEICFTCLVYMMILLKRILKDKNNYNYTFKDLIKDILNSKIVKE